MPLVDITTREGWHATAQQTFAYQLGAALPKAFIAKKAELHLDPDTPEGAVQVDFHEYHPMAINTVDIWLLVRFTEENLTEAHQNEVRSVIEAIVDKALEYYAHMHEQEARVLEHDDPWLRAMRLGKPKIAIDLFWGPGKGCLIYRDGSPTLYW